MNTQYSATTQPSLRPTHVVTCFLTRYDAAESRILIVQRSQRVGSYHGQWAGISGFLEVGVTPDEQAFTEIREETGLPVMVCDDPISAVVLGSGKTLDHLELLREVTIS